MRWTQLLPYPEPVKDLRWRYNDWLARREHRDGRVVLGSRPQFLIIDPTSRCDARCVTCVQSLRAPGEHGADLPRVAFERVAPHITTASHINLFSSGEPMLARDLVGLVRETRRRRCRRTPIWLSTNGRRVPPAVLALLAAPGLGLQFSVDGGTPAVFESIRRGVTFAQLCHSLETVARQRGGRPFPRLSFSATMSKRNLHDLASIFALARRYRVDQVIFYDESPDVAGEERYLLDETDRPAFEAQLPFIRSTGIRYYGNLQFRGAPPAPATIPSAERPGAPVRCLAPWKVFHLFADGNVRTCCTLTTVMGNLIRQTFAEVWNGLGYVALRRAFRTQSGLPPACRSCTDPLRTWERDDPA